MAVQAGVCVVVVGGVFMVNKHEDAGKIRRREKR